MSKYKVGDRVVVKDSEHCYDCYGSWYDIDKVPDFVYLQEPENGRDYVITHIAQHTVCPEYEYENNIIYVLDGRYMVSGEAFNSPVDAEVDWGWV